MFLTLEERDVHIVRLQYAFLDGNAHAIDQMITMRFDKNLYPTRNRFSDQLTDLSLSPGMKVRFRIFYNKDVPFFRS